MENPVIIIQNHMQSRLQEEREVKTGKKKWNSDELTYGRQRELPTRRDLDNATNRKTNEWVLAFPVTEANTHCCIWVSLI